MVPVPGAGKEFDSALLCTTAQRVQDLHTVDAELLGRC